jgi:hypothetical protein
MIYLWSFLTVVMWVLAATCLHLERKSRKWYADRMLIFLSGVMTALGCVSLGALVYCL